MREKRPTENLLCIAEVPFLTDRLIRMVIYDYIIYFFIFFYFFLFYLFYLFFFFIIIIFLYF